VDYLHEMTDSNCADESILVFMQCNSTAQPQGGEGGFWFRAGALSNHVIMSTTV